jgi:ABC-type transport system substrate-binding protein
VLKDFPYPDVAQHIQQNAEKAGVKLNIVQMIGAQLYQRRARASSSSTWPATASTIPDANNMFLRHAYNVDNSDKSNETISIAWRAGWDPGKEFNDAIRAMQVERDQAKRKAIYEGLQRKQRHLADHLLFQRLSVNAVGKDVKVFRRPSSVTTIPASRSAGGPRAASAARWPATSRLTLRAWRRSRSSSGA